MDRHSIQTCVVAGDSRHLELRHPPAQLGVQPRDPATIRRKILRTNSVRFSGTPPFRVEAVTNDKKHRRTEIHEE
jgi:hypothetical protein